MCLNHAKSDTSFESFASPQACVEETNRFFTKYTFEPEPYFLLTVKWSWKLNVTRVDGHLKKLAPKTLCKE